MEIFLIWIALSFVAGFWAESKGRSGPGYFLLSVVLSPLIGLIAAAAASKNEKVLEAKALKSGEFKKCPYCAEVIRSEALKCRYCGADIPRPELKSAPPVKPSPRVYAAAKAAGGFVGRHFSPVEAVIIASIVLVGTFLLYLYVS